VAIVTLLTDFGLSDTYVGQMKGALLAVAPSATLVDLTHSVTAQDVLGGAFRLWSAVEPFPAGTIHLAVVDPGVGSTRRPIALRSGRGDVFVGPDNGLLVPAMERLGGLASAVELTNRAFWRQPPSSTFHGRDVFGPVAGHLAAGVALDQLGRATDHLERPFGLPAPDGHHGEVVHIDTYGNLVTNLPEADLPSRFGSGFKVRIGGFVVPPASHYAAVEPGALLALVGSAGLLEISARDASAAALTGARRGTPVVIEPV
jgi:S-adenosylmethionine hydrolase